MRDRSLRRAIGAMKEDHELKGIIGTGQYEIIYKLSVIWIVQSCGAVAGH